MVRAFDLSLVESSKYSQEARPLLRTANDMITDFKMRAIILTVVGPTTYSLLKTLTSPKKQDELKFSELLDHIALQPQPLTHS